jgi:hypothetical protein
MGKVVNNLDIISLLFILTGGIVILYLSFSAGIGQYGMGLAFLTGAFVYLHLRKSHRMKSLDMDNSNGENTHKTLLLTNAIFFLCFSASIYILDQALYIRPPIYFILVTAAYLSIFIEILYINKEGTACYLNILKTILLSLSFRAGRYFSFATIPGTDTQYHLGLVNLISELGHIPSCETIGYSAHTKYVYTPLWHVLVSSTGILLDADSSKTLFFSIALPFVILISLFVFLIAKKIANVQTGLIALLFVNIAAIVFVRGLTAIYTSSLVLCFFFLILFCFMQERNNTIFSVFILLSISSMVLTHQLSTFCVLIIFFSLLVSKQVYNFLLSQFALKDNEVKKLPLNINTTMFTFFIVFLVYYWSLIGEGYGTSFLSGVVGRLKRSLLRMFAEYTSACLYTNVFATYDIWSNLLYDLGSSILMGLAVVGLLLWLNHKYISLTRFSYIIAVVSLFAVIYLGTYVGLGHMFIPHRFLAFLEVFLVILAAYSVYVIYRAYVQPGSRIFVCFVVAALIFFMVTTPYINRNDTIFCKERVYRSGCTDSEVASAVWAVSHTSNEIIYKDPLFGMYKVPTVADISLSDKNIINYPRGININAKNKRGLVIVRPYFEERGGTVFVSGTFGKMHAHNSSQFLTAVTKNYDLAFSSGVTRVYRCIGKGDEKDLND